MADPDESLVVITELADEATPRAGDQEVAEAHPQVVCECVREAGDRARVSPGQVLHRGDFRRESFGQEGLSENEQELRVHLLDEELRYVVENQCLVDLEKGPNYNGVSARLMIGNVSLAFDDRNEWSGDEGETYGTVNTVLSEYGDDPVRLGDDSQLQGRDCVTRLLYAIAADQGYLLEKI